MDAVTFIYETNWRDLPDVVRNQARRCLLDTLGAGIAGRRTELSRIVHDVAAAVYGGSEAKLWLDGRSVSPPGAALANGMTIDAFDIHDGYLLVKGHAGAAVVPAVLATLPVDAARPVSGQELLSRVVIGYEVALRAGLALHATACDYHTSGAWSALGCAACVGRSLRLDAAQTRHALGIAEYHGPRSQMMRCIDNPTMLKDGSGWGAMTGVSAAFLAKAGFTGAPAVTVEIEEVAAIWSDLGSRWRITEQFFKPFAVCRWAQPAIEGALALQRRHDLPLGGIERIEVRTFHAATRLACRRPTTTEEAQYSLPFPLAAALVHEQLGLAQLSGPGLQEHDVLALADRVALVDDPILSGRFPEERVARVRIETAGGAVLDSGEVRARWDADHPPGDDALIDKFRWLASASISASRTEALLDVVWNAADLSDAGRLLELLTPPRDAPHP